VKRGNPFLTAPPAIQARNPAASPIGLLSTIFLPTPSARRPSSRPTRAAATLPARHEPIRGPVRGASRTVNGHRRRSTRIRGSGGLSSGTPQASRAMALLLFLREATSPANRPAPPVLPPIVASAPSVSWQRTLAGAFDEQSAATYSATGVAPIAANTLHALARPRSLGREELPTPGREVGRLGEASRAADGPREPPMGLPSRRWASRAADGLREPPMGLASRRWASRAADGPREPPMGLASRRWASRVDDGPPEPPMGLASRRWASRVDDGPPEPTMGLRTNGRLAPRHDGMLTLVGPITTRRVAQDAVVIPRTRLPLLQRGRFSVPSPAVMNSAVHGASQSAVCQTPDGFTTASPGWRVTVRAAPSIS